MIRGSVTIVITPFLDASSLLLLHAMIPTVAYKELGDRKPDSTMRWKSRAYIFIQSCYPKLLCFDLLEPLMCSDRSIKSIIRNQRKDAQAPVAHTHQLCLLLVCTLEQI